MSVNKVILVGNLGKDPEVRNLESGKKVAKFSLATSKSYKNASGEKVTNTEWHNVVSYGNLAVLIEKYLSKGDQVYIEGELKTRSWDDNKGDKKYITEVICDEMKFLSNRKEAAKPQSNQEPQSDDLPF